MKYQLAKLGLQAAEASVAYYAAEMKAAKRPTEKNLMAADWKRHIAKAALRRRKQALDRVLG